MEIEELTSKRSNYSDRDFDIEKHENDQPKLE